MNKNTSQNIRYKSNKNINFVLISLQSCISSYYSRFQLLFFLANKKLVLTLQQSFFLILFVVLLSCKKEINDFNIQKTDLGVDYRINDIYFLNSQKGFAVGGDRYTEGYIFITENAGKTWTIIDTSQIYSSNNIDLQTLNSIDFLNDSIGEIVGHGGKILRTENGGKNWSLILNGSWENFYDVKLFTKHKSLIISGGAYGGGFYFRSTNFWYELPTQEVNYTLRDLYFINNQIGYSAGFGFVKKTVNGGKDWEILDLKDDYFFNIHFPTKNIGYICAWQGGIYKTTNAGKTWKNIHPTNIAFSKRYHFENIHFINENTGLVCGRNGELLYTKNGGKDWSTINTGTRENFHSLYFLNESKAFVGTGNGKILQVVLD